MTEALSSRDDTQNQSSRVFCFLVTSTLKQIEKGGFHFCCTHM